MHRVRDVSLASGVIVVEIPQVSFNLWEAKLAKMAGQMLRGPYRGNEVLHGVSEDFELTHVGHGTPGGEYLRRFWQPGALALELGDLPLNVRMLGEDLVLFRTAKGEIGLLDRYCSHRGASLEYGLPSEEGIICCYHGWHYGTDGRIIETPNDPTSTVAGRLFHGAYRTHEYKGIIFAYMGPPEDVPDFPILDTYVEAGNELVPFSLHMPCNWLQVIENFQDPTHSVFLHTRVSGAQFSPSWGQLPIHEHVRTPLGMLSVISRGWKGRVWVRTGGEIILPNINQATALWETGEDEKYFQRVSLTRWMRPIDDEHTHIIGWRHFNDSVDPDHKGNKDAVGKDKIDFIGQTEDERPYDERQRIPGDYEAIVGQRPIAIHDLENLNSADRGVATLRSLVRRGIEQVRSGKPIAPPPLDARGVVPTYSQDTVVKLPGGLGEDPDVIRSVGDQVAKINIDSAKQAPDERLAYFAKHIPSIAANLAKDG